jgi:hypothetical protein
LNAVAADQEQIRTQVEEVQRIADTLNPDSGSSVSRQERFATLQARLASSDDPLCVRMALVMTAFVGGLFVGAEVVNVPVDNLELERWFRLPKGHERRIHGHRHAGVRIVQEGPTLVLALDAHQEHPEAFAVGDLVGYREAEVPRSEQQALRRRKIMRKARSKKRRPALLKELERRYLSS